MGSKRRPTPKTIDEELDALLGPEPDMEDGEPADLETLLKSPDLFASEPRGPTGATTPPKQPPRPKKPSDKASPSRSRGRNAPKATKPEVSKRVGANGGREPERDRNAQRRVAAAARKEEIDDDDDDWYDDR